MDCAPELKSLVADVARAIKAIDAKGHSARSARSGKVYQPGIAPHGEEQVVSLVVNQLELEPQYTGLLRTGIPYPQGGRKRCDLCVGPAGDWEWAIEVKMLRMMGDNGKKNDQMVTKILSPYSQDHSALTDTEKLAHTSLGKRKAILIYGFSTTGFSDANGSTYRGI